MILVQPQILAIGRDRSAFVVGSPLQSRLQLQGIHLRMTLVVMAIGPVDTIKIGHITVRTAGGKNIVTAFIKALMLSYRLVRNEQTYTLVTTQDVLYSGLVGYLVSKIFRLPFYPQLHGDYLDNPAWFKSQVGVGNRCMNLVGKYLLRRADSVRAVSNRLKKQLITQFNIDEKKIISLPIGTDLTIFMSENISLERSRELLFVGRLIPEKEPLLFCDVAIAVCLSNQSVTVGIAGDGFLRQEMENRFKNAGLSDRVNFYGALDQVTLARHYAAAYCYIHTAGWEGWGMPMIESMAGGCPVITTDSGCAGEAVIHEITGLVVPVGDTDALVAAARRLLDDSVLWQRLVISGRQEAPKWSIIELTKRNLEWYEQAS